MEIAYGKPSLPLKSLADWKKADYIVILPGEKKNTKLDPKIIKVNFHFFYSVATFLRKMCF